MILTKLSYWNYPNFSPDEFKCRCCGKIQIESYLVDLLQKLRNQINKSIIVTSGCRCLKHNKKIGGSDNSYHLIESVTSASDIYSPKFDFRKLFLEAELLPFTGLGIYPEKNFVHLDIGTKFRREWLKSKDEFHNLYSTFRLRILQV